MRSRLTWVAFALAFALLPVRALAEAPLTLNEVLQSSRLHAPQVQEALARVRSAEGKLLSAEGAFDTVVSAEATSRVAGFYDGQTLGGTVYRPLADWGGQVYGGYRVATGKFPIYEDKNFTNALGEVKVGAMFSLMRDRLIDDRRFARRNATIDIDIAEADRLLTAITIQRRAVAAYNQWVASGLRLGVYRELLDLAKGRQAGLARQVSAGARPRILLTENEQNVLRRQTLVARAEQDLALAANTLSLFWRDDEGKPQRPDPARLPGDMPMIGPVYADAAAVIAARPDLRQIDMRITQATNRLDLDRNTLRPRLDFRAEASQDIGAEGAGGPSRTPGELILGLNFSVPLQQRVARGRIAQSNAEIDAQRRRRQQIEEQITAELEGLSIDVRGTERLRQLAEQELAVAQTMARAEARRFEAGASDFFLVNAREEAAADASIRKLDASVRQIVARAELAAASVDLKTLGLD
ncbi:TolC family protein [Sphingomonas sp. 28-62-11]|uniref:TolC family protein n=1 Tax=Sphingomonas sp. 28-62-11 TaxID=1970432 RepID=UPI000BC6F536|nr:MAG: multidrug transporter [Sphingomonas sp. 28-62-11]